MSSLNLKNNIKVYLFSIVLIVSFGCASISSFDQYAYIQTTSLKVDALNIMDLAIEDYETHKLEVKELQTSLQKLYEYEKNRINNEITLQMWDKLLNEEGHLLGGFIKKWEKDTTLNIAFINNSKKQVSSAFDIIASLESNKNKPSDYK